MCKIFNLYSFENGNNFFAGNYAEANGINFDDILPVVEFDKSTGVYNPTPPNRWSNICGLPAFASQARGVADIVEVKNRVPRPQIKEDVPDRNKLIPESKEEFLKKMGEL